MGIYLKKFENHTLYDSYINGGDAILPNVSICTTEEDVHYNPYVPETRVVAKYNVTSTSSPTPLRTSFESNIFKSMEIDGVMLDELVTEYTFDTTGEHTVKYELYDETKLGNNAPVFYNSNLVEIIIPNSVTSICTNALLNCSGLTSITIGSGVTSIGTSAFSGCSSMTSIDIPDSVTSIGGSAFIGTDALKVLNYNAKCELSSSFRGNWPNLETVIIGDSTPSIGSQFFQGCSGLTSVTIGNGVTSIGTEAFYGCNGLTNVIIGNGVTSINQSAFKGCSSLTSITIPDSVTSIGSGAFINCSNLVSVTLPDSITSIDGYTFQDCSVLASIDIPDSVTSIGDNAFEDCTSLTRIISHAMTAPTISNYTFKDIKTGGTLTVPSGSTGYDVWMSTSNWYLGSYNWTKVEQ